MKLNYLTLILLLSFIFISCKKEQKLQHQLIGKWEVVEYHENLNYSDIGAILFKREYSQEINYINNSADAYLRRYEKSRDFLPSHEYTDWNVSKDSIYTEEYTMDITIEFYESGVCQLTRNLYDNDGSIQDTYTYKEYWSRTELGIENYSYSTDLRICFNPIFGTSHFYLAFNDDMLNAGIIEINQLQVSNTNIMGDGEGMIKLKKM